MRRSSIGFAEHGGGRYGRYDRVLQRVGHLRPFTFVIRYAGSKVDRLLYRASRGRVTLAGPGLPTMLLTTRGRRTGKPRTVPVFYVRDGRNLVAASENFGLAAAASWPGNLRADPCVTIQVGSTSASYRARPATAAEVDRAMPRLLSIWPAHETYLQRTGNRYVFVFEPLRGSSPATTKPPRSPEGDRHLLLSTMHTARQQIHSHETVEQLLHGEPHSGNLLSTEDGLLFIDFETSCRGPVEFDVAHVPDEVSALSGC